jgi:hypothetical protein
MLKRNLVVLIVTVLLGFLMGGFTLSLAEKTTGKDEQVRQDVLYTCACGEGCSCNSVSKTPGDCQCGKPMAWGHVVKVEGDEALVCNCAEGCTCKQDADDPTKCGCGKKLKRVSLKDSGLFFCNCGGSCTCNTLSDEPGKCQCGMKLKQH